MRIGIDARLYSESGVGRYLRNLISSLQKSDLENEYFIFLRAKDYQLFKESENFKKVLADIHWYGIKEQIELPKILNTYKLDLMHFPHFNVPLFYKGKFIVTIHDLIHQKFHMNRVTTRNPFIYKLKRVGYSLVFRNAVIKSEKIITVSEYVKEELLGKWKVKQDKIFVTPEAVDEGLASISKNISNDKSQQILKKLNVVKPYIFYVGNAHPHKNIEQLIKVFLSLRREYQYLKLVLAGPDHYFWQRIKKEFIHKDIIYTGFLNEEELVVLYKNSQLFVMPSLEEGFGIPLLEAMSLKVPVVSSDAGSLKEVGGDAVLYFNPKDKEDMKRKIMDGLNNQSLRKQLIEKGEKRGKDFSWNKMAKQTLGLYKSLK